MHRILPVLVRGDRIFLAMADPLDKRVVDEIEFVTNKKVYAYVAMQTTLIKVITDAYDAHARGEKHYLGPRVPAETLKQLGVSASPGAPPAPAQPARRLAAEPPPQPPPPKPAPLTRGQAPPLPPMRPKAPTSPPRESVIVDEATETASRNTEVSTSDFGVLGQDVSSVTNLPDDLRAGAAQAASAIASGAGKLILVVDDEEEIRKLLNRLLTQKGYRVIEADRGLLALRLVKEHVPDLIILDAMLPELHGFDIARRIKGSAKYGHIPVVMVSAVYRGWRIAEDLKQNYGVEAYIEKPFRIADVLETVAAPPRDARGRGAAAREARPRVPLGRGREGPQRGRRCLQGRADRRGHRAPQARRRHRPARLPPPLPPRPAAGQERPRLRGDPGARARHRPELQALRGPEEPRRALRKGGLQEQGHRDVGAVRSDGARRGDPRHRERAPSEVDLSPLAQASASLLT